MKRLFLIAVGFLASVANAQTPLPALSADDVAARMEATSTQASLSQPTFVCERTYALDYSGFPGSKHAEMRVRSEQSGTRKRLTIVAESGSQVLRTKVLHQMIATEEEASIGALHETSRFIRKNYNFSLVGTDTLDDRLAYVLTVRPKVKSKVAWAGKVWIDGTDFAVVRAKGYPDKMPSWWTTHSEFISTYKKIDGYWLPEKNISETRVRMGGHAHLVIDYNNCSAVDRADVASYPSED